MEAERVVDGRAHPGGGRSVRLRRQESAENFPVAMRVLPAAVRTHLRAVYDVVRVIDNLGDDPGSPAGPAGRADGVPGRPGHRLDHRDTRGTRCCVRWCPRCARSGCSTGSSPSSSRPTCRTSGSPATGRTSELRGYCALSANPVGRLVLHVFGVGTPARVALSDRVCTRPADHRALAGRRRGPRRAAGSTCPARTWRGSACAEPTWPRRRRRPPCAAARVRGRAGRARCSTPGAPLVGTLRGWARVAVAGYVAGGLAAADALRRRRATVLAARRGVKAGTRPARAGAAGSRPAGRGPAADRGGRMTRA